MPTTADGPDPRSRSQRLGDGFAELLRRYLNAGASPTQGGESRTWSSPSTTTGSQRHRHRHPAAYGHPGLGADRAGVRLRRQDQLVHPPQQERHRQRGGRNGSGGGSPDEKGADQGRGGKRGPALSDPTRLYTGKTRRLLELRDRGCAFPGCDRPPPWTHAHHIIAWSRGGPTTVDNGVLLCGHHHRLIHQGHWTVAIADDGQPEFTPPDWIDPQRKPLRNHPLRT